ncbi:MAG: SitI3 family protein [Chloroflexota bacterium]
MTESYTLYLATSLPVEAVLEMLFEPKSIAPLEGTNLLYARGLVYLAHGQPLPEKMQERLHGQFGFSPSISIRYFPDGVSAVETAFDMLVTAIVRWLADTTHDMVLAVSKTSEIIKRLDATVTYAENHPFWTASRRELITPYVTS